MNLKYMLCNSYWQCIRVPNTCILNDGQVIASMTKVKFIKDYMSWSNTLPSTSVSPVDVMHQFSPMLGVRGSLSWFRRLVIILFYCWLSWTYDLGQ